MADVADNGFVFYARHVLGCNDVLVPRGQGAISGKYLCPKGAILYSKIREEEEREQFRGQLKAYRNLYAFLSQIIPYQDSDLERLYAFVRNLLAKLPSPGDGQAFVLDDEVALRFFRLQQMTEGSIGLSEGDARSPRSTARPRACR